MGCGILSCAAGASSVARPPGLLCGRWCPWGVHRIRQRKIVRGLKGTPPLRGSFGGVRPRSSSASRNTLAAPSWHVVAVPPPQMAGSGAPHHQRRPWRAYARFLLPFRRHPLMETGFAPEHRTVRYRSAYCPAHTGLSTLLSATLNRPRLMHTHTHTHTHRAGPPIISPEGRPLPGLTGKTDRFGLPKTLP